MKSNNSNLVERSKIKNVIVYVIDSSTLYISTKHFYRGSDYNSSKVDSAAKNFREGAMDISEQTLKFKTSDKHFYRGSSCSNLNEERKHFYRGSDMDNNKNSDDNYVTLRELSHLGTSDDNLEKISQPDDYIEVPNTQDTSENVSRGKKRQKRSSKHKFNLKNAPEISPEVFKKKKKEFSRKIRKDYSLNKRELERFNNLYNQKKKVIESALFSTKIPNDDHNEYSSYALDAFMKCFFTLYSGGITREKFDNYLFWSVKHAVYDEIRKTAVDRDKNCSYEEHYQNVNLHPAADNSNILLIELFEYLTKVLTKKEAEFLETFLKNQDLEQTCALRNICVPHGRKLRVRILKKCEDFFKKSE